MLAIDNSACCAMQMNWNLRWANIADLYAKSIAIRQDPMESRPGE